MARKQWSLLRDRPRVQVLLTPWRRSQSISRNLLADTGASSSSAPFDLLLDVQDCLACGARLSQMIVLRSAYRGSYPVFWLRVQIPDLNFDLPLRVVGVPTVPVGFDGIACFRFLNRFTYGNFGDSKQFGLET